MAEPFQNHSREMIHLYEKLNLHLNAQTLLCNQLETIADELPRRVDNQQCLLAAQKVYPVVMAAHSFEENELFPALMKADPSNAHLATTIERLHGEHWEDESFAHEISDTLKSFVAGREKNIDKLSYMLRGFFEGLRRHIAFEKEMLSSLTGEAT
ncbi:hemerythrin domain-containing protein [Ahrensia kielensis]|uniref:hemerythrin domain-containing protein n=1 Tax=Ahrensia kielensis TaxID=76980 RepID=UPI0003711B42|nr:hemerythrin domain-containing protein [Ahrensia kielensis]